MPFSPGSESAELGTVEGAGAGGPLAQVRVLRAVLKVDELVADAAEALHVDAGAQVGAGAAGDAAGGDLQRGGRDERGLLAGVALGRRVGDVVAGRVEQPLLGEEPAQRRLEAVEGGDRHDLRLQVQDAVERRARRRAGRRAVGAGVAGLGLLPDRAGSGGRGRRAPAASAHG